MELSQFTVLVYVCVKCGFDLLIVSTEWTNLAFSIANFVEKLIFLNAITKYMYILE